VNQIDARHPLEDLAGEMRVLPVPLEEKLKLPGFALASAMSSRTLAAARSGAREHERKSHRERDRREIAQRVIAQLAVQAGLMACDAEAISRVWPSAGALAASSVPSMVPAPGGDPGSPAGPIFRQAAGLPASR